MGLLIGMIVGGLTLFISSLARAKSQPQGSLMTDPVNMNSPAIKQWESYVRPAAIQHHIDPGVAMYWIGVESGGNVCAVGEPFARGPDGAPREVGLFQLYNPDDFAKLKAKAVDLRAYCVKPGPGERDPQKQSRALTAEEIAHHVALGIAKMQDCISVASHYMTAAKITWGVNNADFWRMVKLVHALPIIVNTGIAQVARKLNRAPLSWSEFRSTYESVNPRAKYNPALKEQDGYWRALQNAEFTGNHFEGQSVA